MVRFLPLLVTLCCVSSHSRKCFVRANSDTDNAADDDNVERSDGSMDDSGRICSLSMADADGECPYQSSVGPPTGNAPGVRSPEAKRGNGTLPYVPVDVTEFLRITGNTTNTASRNDMQEQESSRHLLRSVTPKQRISATRWGLEQVMEKDAGVSASLVQELIAATEEYMKHTVLHHKEYKNVRRMCRNRDKLCSQWAVQGHCQSNPRFMQVQCAPACQSCDMLDITKRCPWNATISGTGTSSSSHAWPQIGDLHRMFERVTMMDSYWEQEYGPLEVLSRPMVHSKRFGRNNNNVNAILPDGPWIVALDNFLTLEECDRLVELGNLQGYEPSLEVGKEKFDGTRGMVMSPGRTSSNAWCMNECSKDPLVQNVIERLANLTAIPKTNMEHLQLLRYEEGQHYGNHFDYNYHERERPQGVRILTVFLYLNDVEEGGETQFTGLTRSITVTPKRGKAVIFPNVLNHDPNSLDRRTKHQALPVEFGIKHGANVWFHQRDFQTPYTTGCTA